jgi:hypothetical protein
VVYVAIVCIVEQICLMFALIVVRVVGGGFIVDHFWFAFICNRLHRDIFFSDTVLLNVTDRNGTEIASTQVLLYKCRTATRCVHVRECYINVEQLQGVYM